MISISYFVLGLSKDFSSISFYGNLISGYFSVYILYEVIAGISGWNFNSRRVGMVLRLAHRIYMYFGFIITYIYSNYFEGLDQLHNNLRLWLGLIVIFEIVIMIRENVHGFIPLNITSYDYRKGNQIFTPVILILMGYYAYNVNYFAGPTPLYAVYALVISGLILARFGQISITSDQYFHFGIFPLIAFFRFETTWMEFFLLEEGIMGIILLALKILGFIIFAYAIYMMYINKIDKTYNNSEKSEIGFLKTKELQLWNYLDRGKFSLYFLVILVLIIISFNFLQKSL